MIKQIFNTIINYWDRFWFSKMDLYPISIFRIVMSLCLFYFYLGRSFDINFLFTDQGFFPTNYKDVEEIFGLHPSILYYIKSINLIFALHMLFLVSLLALSLGFFTNTSALIAFILHIMFTNRNLPALYGIDMIASFYLLYLPFTNSGAYFSLDNYFKKKKGNDLEIINSQKCSLINSVIIRFMQIQICIIYFYSGIHKLKGTRWWNGSAVWDVLSEGSLNSWNISFISWFPSLLTAMTYTIILWEIYFIALVWRNKSRLPVLCLGLFLHCGMGIFLGIPIFSLYMTTIYLIFLKREELESIWNFFQNTVFKRKKVLELKNST